MMDYPPLSPLLCIVHEGLTPAPSPLLCISTQGVNWSKCRLSINSDHEGKRAANPVKQSHGELESKGLQFIGF